MPETPILAYDNLLKGTAYTILAGVDEPSALLSDAWVWDMARPALPRTDALGVLSFRVNVATGFGFGVDAAGNNVSFSQTLPFGGTKAAEVLILGAARNNPSGVRFSGGHLQILADAVEIFAQTIYEPKNTSALYRLPPHAVPATYTITISNLAANATVRLPEVFIGAALHMPGLELGHDLYPEALHSITFKAATGREIVSKRFVRIEQALNWRYIEPAKANELLLFIENALENFQPFWFCAFPDTSPSKTYMGLHMGNKATMPLTYGMMIERFSLKFQEKL